MDDAQSKDLITSKEILSVTGISRATLNNYIKMGIIPKPVVRKPIAGMEGVKKIGYFPRIVLDRIKTVKELKGKGHSMEDISKRFGQKRIRAQKKEKVEAEPPAPERMAVRTAEIYGGEVKVTFEDVSFPSYLVNYRFEVEWINREAEEKILKQGVSLVRDVGARNIFKLLFNWEFHNLVQNWKDIASFHMAFAKAKYSKTWISRLYRGISKREVSILEEIYDKVSTSPKESIKHTPLNLLLKDGTTESYRVYSIFFREGMFFNYAPASILYHRGDRSSISGSKSGPGGGSIN
jgi:transcriptional regulator with XRE-family HTH domain